MNIPLIRAIASSAALLIFFSPSFAQRPKSTLACKQTALSALKPMPELSYSCDDQLDDFDEKVLKLPARVAAIKSLTAELASFTDAAWWTTSTRDLTVCDFTQAPGVLTAEQRQSFLDHSSWLFGNDRIRLVLIPDPCYQTQYSGSNAFLLHRNDGRVTVTQVLDGYFSRADNSVDIALARLNAEEIIEISTGTGGMTPSLTNYYFVIDPRSKQAVPKNLFRGADGPTNKISSAYPLSTTTYEPLKIIRRHALARSFTVYFDKGGNFARKIMRWNGRIYR